MKIHYKFFIAAFLWNGLFFGIITSGFDVVSGEGFSLLKFSLHTVGFGLAMALWYTHQRNRQQKKLEKENKT